MSVLLALALFAAPYVDPSERFRFEIGPSFELSPRFGDTEGIRLVAPEQRGGGEVSFELRIAPPARCADGPAAWTRVAATAERVEHRRVVGGRCLVTFVSGSRRARSRLSAELSAMRASVEAPEPPSVASPPPPSRAKALVGSWLGPADSRMQLLASGRFSLGPSTGRWRTEGERLIFETSAGAQSISYALAGDVLVLSGGGLEAPVSYRRDETAPPARSVPPDSAASGRDEAGGAGPVGQWRKGQAELWLGPDGRFSFGPHQGRWSLTEGRIRLELGPVDIVSYAFRMKGNALILSGADLDAPLRLERVEGPPGSR